MPDIGDLVGRVKATERPAWTPLDFTYPTIIRPARTMSGYKAFQILDHVGPFALGEAVAEGMPPVSHAERDVSTMNLALNGERLAIDASS